MAKRVIVDRIIGDIAVCEMDGMTIDINLDRIDGDVRAGDVLVFQGISENDRMAIDEEATEARKSKIRRKFEKLKKK